MPASTTGDWTQRRVTDPDTTPVPAWGELSPARQLLWVNGRDELLPAMERLWPALATWIAAQFPGAHIKQTPSATSLAMIERTLPWPTGAARPQAYPTLAERLARLIAATSPQHRAQLVATPGTRARTLRSYDARLAYAAYMRELPVISEGGVQVDEVPDYEPYRQGRYLCRIQVPAGWDRLGLVPRALTDSGRWDYPNTPGMVWEQWLDTAEVGLLRDYGWGHAIRSRLLFAKQGTPGADPLRTWQEKLCAKIEEIDAGPGRELSSRHASRLAVRGMLLHPVGRWHQSSNARELIGVTFADLAALDLEDAHIMRRADGLFDVKGRGELSTYQARWRRVEWSAAIYARERVAVTRRALTLPAGTLGAIIGDELVTLNHATGWQDTGRVGCYRGKHAASYAAPGVIVPATLGALQSLASGINGRAVGHGA